MDLVLRPARHPERSEGSARPNTVIVMFVYILASRTRRLYVGVTRDLIRRVWEHQTGIIRGFTRKYGIKRLVYYESFFAAADAIRREKQIKSYARAKKLAMVSAKGSG